MSGFLLDTNCVSEMVRINPDPRVTEWMEAADEATLYLSVLTLGEIRESLTNARQLVDLSPRTANEMLDRALAAARRLRGRHPAIDQVLGQLEHLAATTHTTSVSPELVARLEALLVVAG